MIRVWVAWVRGFVGLAFALCEIEVEFGWRNGQVGTVSWQLKHLVYGYQLL